MNIRNLISAITIIGVFFLNSCTKNADGTVTVIPIAPTALKATTFSTTAINLTWTDNSTNEDGFKIERKNGVADFSLIATLGVDKTAYKDSLLTPNTTYIYRVYSYNSAGRSITYTNLDSAKTVNSTLVTIGTMVWSNKNLDVSKYRNGDTIPQVTDPIAWNKLTTGAWCYLNNDPANGAKYGKLYNWYAVNDKRGLAPIGWHVASYDEWINLTTSLGGVNVAGDKMKETGTFWSSLSTNPTNSSGFSALPGGYRDYLGAMSNGNAVWWTSSLVKNSSSNSVWEVILNANRVDCIIRGSIAPNNERPGSSVRCIKD